jgi:hypothetical protein
MPPDALHQRQQQQSPQQSSVVMENTVPSGSNNSAPLPGLPVSQPDHYEHLKQAIFSTPTSKENETSPKRPRKTSGHSSALKPLVNDPTIVYKSGSRPSLQSSTQSAQQQEGERSIATTIPVNEIQRDFQLQTNWTGAQLDESSSSHSRPKLHKEPPTPTSLENRLDKRIQTDAHASSLGNVPVPTNTRATSAYQAGTHLNIPSSHSSTIDATPMTNVGLVGVNQERLLELFSSFLQGAALNSNEFAVSAKSSIPTLGMTSEPQEIPQAVPSPTPYNDLREADEPPAKRIRLEAENNKDDTLAVVGQAELDNQKEKEKTVTFDDNVEGTSSTRFQPPVTEIKPTLCQSCLDSQQIVLLYQTIDRLRTENQELREACETEIPIPSLPPRVQIFHRVSCRCDARDGIPNARQSTYLDAPRRKISHRRWHLQGDLNAPEYRTYLNQNEDVVLLVFQDYSCSVDEAKFVGQGRGPLDIPNTEIETKAPTAIRESFLINSETLRESLTRTSQDSTTPGRIQSFELWKEYGAPYLYIYHDRHYLGRKLRDLDEEHRIQMDLLIDYVVRSFEASSESAGALFAEGMVSWETISYLYEPKTVVVTKTLGELVAYETTGWVTDHSKPGEMESSKDNWSWIVGHGNLMDR